jgi:hypothetical protein
MEERLVVFELLRGIGKVKERSENRYFRANRRGTFGTSTFPNPGTFASIILPTYKLKFG